MSKATRWLYHDDSHSKIIFNNLLVWAFITSNLLVNFALLLRFPLTQRIIYIEYPVIYSWTLYVIFDTSVLVVIVFVEEVLFRWIPLVIAVSLFRKPKYIIASALLSSLLFGILHGGIINIFGQGVAGFYLSVIFLKFGGLQNKFIRALYISFSAHFLFNAITITAIFITGLLGSQRNIF